VEKVRNIMTFLQEMEDVQELRDVPSWNAHQLTGDRKGTWSLTVTRNWRVTFRIDQAEGEIFDLTQQKKYFAKPIPPFMQELIEDGGLILHLRKKGLKGNS
jgi:plasmid maintenance system killer protein